MRKTSSELLGEHMAKKAAERSATMTKALAVVFISQVVEDHSGDLTEDEQIHALQVAMNACEDMQNAKVQITAYNLFKQAVKFLEKGY